MDEPNNVLLHVTAIAPNSRVTIADDIDATVHAFTVRGTVVTSYEVVWWDGRDRHEEWVSAAEVKAMRSVPDR